MAKKIQFSKRLLGYFVEVRYLRLDDSKYSSWEKWKYTRIYDSRQIDNTLKSLRRDYHSSNGWKYEFRKRPVYVFDPELA